MPERAEALVNSKMRIGFPGLISEVPYPLTGMGFGNNGDVETTELASGGRHIHQSPTTHKTYSLSWSAKTSGLQPLVDLYNRRYGNQILFIQDPNNVGGNMLPPRWAYSYQLAHQSSGQGQPYIDTVAFPPEVVYNDKGWGAYPPGHTSMLIPGKDHYLKVWGTRTGASGVRWRVHNATTRVWTAWAIHVPTATNTAPQLVCSAANTAIYDFMQMEVYVPTGSTLRLSGMDFSTSDYRTVTARRPGEGVGGLRFSNNLDGTLVSSRIERIGLSVEMTEVEYLYGW